MPKCFFGSIEVCILFVLNVWYPSGGRNRNGFCPKLNLIEPVNRCKAKGTKGLPTNVPPLAEEKSWLKDDWTPFLYHLAIRLSKSIAHPIVSPFIKTSCPVVSVLLLVLPTTVLPLSRRNIVYPPSVVPLTPNPSKQTHPAPSKLPLPTWNSAS